MTQHCPYDEKLLDYVYEEMSAEEHQAFSEHLAGCASCQGALAKLQGVRSAFRELPQPHIEEDSLQRMTAQILQQAQPPSQSSKKPAVQTLGSTKDLPSAEVGKLLPFRRKGLKAILFHPASGVVAAAAMALVFVVAKNWQNEPILPTLVEKVPPPGAIKAEPAAAPAPVSTTALEGAPREEARKELAAAETTLADEEDRSGRLGAKGDRGPAKPAVSAPATPMKELPPPKPSEEKAVAGLRRDAPEPTAPGGQMGGQAEGRWGGKLGGSGAANGLSGGVAKGRGKNKDDLDGLLDSAAGGPSGGALAVPADKAEAPKREPTAQRAEREQTSGARDRGGEESVPSFDSLAKRQAAPQAAPAPPPPPVAQAPAAQAPAPAAGPRPFEPRASAAAPEIVEGKDMIQEQVNNQHRNELLKSTTRRPRALSSENQDGAAPLLAQLREQLKKGQCREAGETLQQLERRFPDTEVPSDERAAVRTCLGRQNQNLQQNQAGPYQFDDNVAESAPRAKSPAPDYRRSKKAAPPPSKAKSNAF